MWGAGPLPHVLLCKDKPGALETRKVCCHAIYCHIANITT